MSKLIILCLYHKILLEEISGKSGDKGNVLAYNTYGTSRINAYKIIEQTLNAIAQAKQESEYDGQYIQFGGMNPEITLRKHQINAIAHILLCNKSLFVVPNHIIEQYYIFQKKVTNIILIVI